MKVGWVAGYFISETVDSDSVGLELVLGNDEAREAVEVLLAEEISGPLAPDHGSLVRMELAEENRSDVPDLPASLVF